MVKLVSKSVFKVSYTYYVFKHTEQFLILASSIEEANSLSKDYLNNKYGKEFQITEISIYTPVLQAESQEVTTKNSESQEVITKNSELKSTVSEMLSSDYKDRFKAEYKQLYIRYNKLKNMVTNWDSLTFTPTCPKATYTFQLRAMEDYITILEIRAKLENINL